MDIGVRLGFFLDHVIENEFILRFNNRTTTTTMGEDARASVIAQTLQSFVLWRLSALQSARSVF